MSTGYPSALDNFTNPGSSDNLSSPPHHTQHSDANDAIEAIEATLGVKFGARVRATRATGVTVNTASWALVGMTGEDFDTDGFHDNVTNNDRITIPTGLGGIYLVIGDHGAWQANATGHRAARIIKNGTTEMARVSTAGVDTSLNPSLVITAVLSLAAGDYINLQAWQNSGLSLTVNQLGWASLAAIKIA